MTEEERQRLAAAGAAEAGESLDDEAPPEIPDLAGADSVRPSAKPPPKPRRTSTDALAAVRPGSIPPPPPSSRRLLAADSIGMPRTPNIELVELDLALDPPGVRSESPSPESRVPGRSQPPPVPSRRSEPTSEGGELTSPSGDAARQQGSSPARSASQPPPRSASQPPPRSASQPPPRSASQPDITVTRSDSEPAGPPSEPPRPASVPPRPASVPPRPASVPPPSFSSQPPRAASVRPPPSSLAEAGEGTKEDSAVAGARSALPSGSNLERGGGSEPPAVAAGEPALNSEPALDTVVESERPAPDVAEASSPDSIAAEGEDDLASPSEHSEPPPAGASSPPAQGESSFAAGKGMLIPDDAVPSSVAAVEVAASPPSALMAMRIISIGEPEAPPSAEAEAEALDAEELDEEDIAPDSGRREPLDPALVDDTVPITIVKPPPPPRAKRPPPPRTSADKERAVKEAQQKRKVRPWWEELFGDDFSRAIFNPTRKQISAEVDFIEQSLGVAPGGVVLDLACGSGQHAVELASRGYAVVGYDLSISMLAQAQEIAQERGQKLNFLQGDMREMAFDETFDAIYCWGSSFGYFEEEKNINVAQRMLKALRPGGTLVLDVVNRDYVAVQTPSSVWFEGDGCVCMDDAQVDWITSRLKVKRTVMLDDGRSKECNYSMRLYSLHELGKLLHDVGFAIRNASGQPATPGVFFGPASSNIIVLAQRPK